LSYLQGFCYLIVFRTSGIFYLGPNIILVPNTVTG